MPLVDSQATGDKNVEWQNKLVGKTLHDEETTETTFSKKELPEKHRIVKPGQMMTRDFRVDRLNVHVNDDNIVTKVNFG
ncbi:unnamed protein product [Clonostachys rosea]|uniref:Proteinase inhibitor I78 n=1 Tax=Bionectria ochroleuca TaxID=29856 RepID=A0ABY6U5A1_BIOOC|nr:unnamed protein product [Clonostachys rosea]